MCYRDNGSFFPAFRGEPAKLGRKIRVLGMGGSPGRLTKLPVPRGPVPRLSPEHRLRRKLFSMLLADQYAADLLRTARDYIWLAEFGAATGRDTFSLKRDGVVNVMHVRTWTGSSRRCGGNWEKNASTDNGAGRPERLLRPVLRCP
jgi:hypothetical protein